MSFIRFLASKDFVRQLLIAIGILVLLGFIVLKWLNYSTNHGQAIEVPDLSKLDINEAGERLSELTLAYIVLDTLEFNKEYPPYSVVSQDPTPGSMVKENRKIYLKLNASQYSLVTVPDLIEKTYRQALPTLRTLGLEVGEITYKPYLGKDMVLEMRHNGKKINPGDQLMKTSKVDLVLGDGKISFEGVTKEEIE